MSDMRHHAIFRHREFATFLRLRRCPSASPHPPLPPLHPATTTTPSSATATPTALPLHTTPCSTTTFPTHHHQPAPAFAKTTLGSARKRRRDPDDFLTSAASIKTRRKHEPVFAPVTSPTAVANVITPQPIAVHARTHPPEFDPASASKSSVAEYGPPPPPPPSHEMHRPLAAPASGSESEGADDSQLTPGFDCELCNTRFYRKHHLERHIQNIHEGQRPWTCDLCGFAFHQKPNLERHIMTVHEEQRPFRCNVCEMSFGRKGVLKKHVQMVHEHSRKFECETCKISFGLKSDLKRHVQSVHQKKRPFVCEVCSASFGRRSDLKRHTLSLHPGAEVPSRRNSGPSSGQDTS